MRRRRVEGGIPARDAKAVVVFSGTSVGGGKRQEKGKGRKGKFGWIETVCACSGRLLSGRTKRGGVWLPRSSGSRETAGDRTCTVLT